MWPNSSQFEHWTLLPSVCKYKNLTMSEEVVLQSFGSGHSREKWPVFSQFRHVTLSMFFGSVQSFATWPSWLQLRQVRPPDSGQSFAK